MARPAGLVLLLVACGSEAVPADPPSHPSPSADTATSLPVLLEGPSYSVPDDGEALLVGELSFRVDRPVTPTLHIDGPCGRQSIRFEEAEAHVLPVLGLHMGSEHVLTLELEGADGVLQVEAGVVTTPWLSEIPPIEVHAHDPARMEPGLLVVTPYASERDGWVLAVDEALHVVYALRRKVDDLTLDVDGTWVANHDDHVVRWDVFGREISRWTDTEHRVHHEAFPLPDGGVLTLAGGTAVEPEYPTDATLQSTSEQRLIAQRILRFDGSGVVVEDLHLADVLDTRQVGYLSVAPGNPRDWSHANGVVPWDDDSYLVTVRHLDVIACIERDGTLRWLLGDPSGWRTPWSEAFLEPSRPIDTWLRHPHAPEVHPDGVVVVFDNGNFGGSPHRPAPPGHVERSRGLALRVDEVAGTFEEVFSLPYDGLYSYAQGDADWLPTTGNVLMVFSRTGGLPSRTRVVQLHPERPDAPALDVSIGGDGRRFVYRAELVPSLYP